MNRKQTGAIDLVVVCAMLFGAIAVLSLIKIAPLYMDHWAIEEAIQAVVDESAAEGKPSKKKMQKMLSNRLQVNRIDFITSKDLKFERAKSTITATVDYERRVPLLFNIDVVVKFPATSASAGYSGG